MGLCLMRNGPVEIALQWGHGREAMDGLDSNSADALSVCFNGATAVRPCMVARLLRGAARARQLQWGHGREAMDGLATAIGTVGNSLASMGPRP